MRKKFEAMSLKKDIHDLDDNDSNSGSDVEESYDVSGSRSFSESNIELPETDEEEDDSSKAGNWKNNEFETTKDSEDDDFFSRRKKKNVRRILDDSDSEEEVHTKRKSLYEAEPDGDTSYIAENKGFSKSTRRSIVGFTSANSSKENNEIISDSDDDSGDSEIIISDEENDLLEEKKNVEESKENLDASGMIGQKLSSTVRSPLKEDIKNESILNDSEISSHMNKSRQSTSLVGSIVSFEDEMKVQTVSRSFYEKAIAERDILQNRYKNGMRTYNLYKNELPDGGKKLYDALVEIGNEAKEKEIAVKHLVVTGEIFSKESQSESESDSFNIPANYMTADDVKPKFTGKVGMKNFENQKILTVEKLQNIHESLNERPSENVLESPPKYLKLELMKHQLHALAFMIWREKSNPRGGILADDMGLGKTLTVISLILKQLQAEEQSDESQLSDDDVNNEKEDQEQEWIARGHKAYRDGGTLVICPASLMNQWEQEIKTKVRRGVLDINVFHGPKRIARSKELAKFDVVITTYQIILSEKKNDGCIFGIKWDRIVLDEGHVIRNYRSKQSEAVCSLAGKKRWVLTGTPIQNQTFDIYAAIKFIRCSPFDDLRYWRTWIEVKGGGFSARLQALLKSILLRRTKQQLMSSGEINTLPEKIFDQFSVLLNREERKVYNKMMVLSQKIFANFIAQHQEKHNNYTYDTNQLGRLHKKFANHLNIDREIQAHEILTLLLRLRQICCHPGLAKAMIENSEFEGEQIVGMDASANDDSDMDILNKLKSMKISDADDEMNEDVFNMDIPSSKIEKLMEVIEEKLVGSEDKAIIVSQWVSYLNIIKNVLEIKGIDYCELNGKIPVKNRNDIVVEFNNPLSGKKVLLLSITAGGVGLNLVGANMLFIMDPHWNPAIEQQAQDRIYRFGQTKNVHIYKFICEDTIEEAILKKQQEKMDIATSTLTGAKRSGTKLTIEDLKDLFGMKNI